MSLLWLLSGALFPVVLAHDAILTAQADSIMRKEHPPKRHHHHDILEAEDQHELTSMELDGLGHADVRGRAHHAHRHKLKKTWITTGRSGHWSIQRSMHDPAAGPEPPPGAEPAVIKACDTCVECPHGADCLCAYKADFEVLNQKPDAPHHADGGCTCSKDPEGHKGDAAPDWCKNVDCECDASSNWCVEAWENVGSDSDPSYACPVKEEQAPAATGDPLGLTGDDTPLPEASEKDKLDTPDPGTEEATVRSCDTCVDCPHDAPCLCAFPADFALLNKKPDAPEEADLLCRCEKEDTGVGSATPDWCKEVNCQCDNSANWCAEEWDKLDDIWVCTAGQV